MIKDCLKNKKAVLFDLDGTLVDSMWMWPQIDVEFLGRFGYDCPGDLERAVEGMSFSETAAYFKERFSLPMTLEEIKECWSQMAMDKYRTQVPLKPGALEFLRYCKDQGIATGIATSNGRPIVDAVIEALQIGEYFQEVATACEVEKESRSRIFIWRWRDASRWLRRTVLSLRMFRRGSWRANGPG